MLRLCRGWAPAAASARRSADADVGIHANTGMWKPAGDSHRIAIVRSSFTLARFPSMSCPAGLPPLPYWAQNKNAA